ncbi:polysaccharide deacetylase family protein [Daejeonella oryzae]|uniref:polysaccharide deacetylase family protein n=1 Tax=Daejeonella oryzae TaxID=1122943 RepID=UPI000416B63F|nr:polysaccharide deacetylase family protein [Daejeonella oryzae]
MYLAYSPFWLRWLYRDLTWHKSRKEKCIYLTFDDGPIPVVTPWVLNTLKDFNIKATFFCIGENVFKYPEVYQQILNDGHSVGNHTYNHLKGWKTADEIYLANVSQCAGFVKSSLFRPPYGRIKKSQIANLKSQFPNLEIIMWDVLSGDFDQDLNPEKCLQNVLKHTQNGSVIVFHDSLKAFDRLKYALPLTIEKLQQKGFVFSALPQVAEI